MGDFLDAWPLLGDSVIAGAVAGGTLGLLGTYVVLRRMVFLCAALSQMAGFGVTLAFVVAIAVPTIGALLSPTLGATVATLAVVAWLMTDRTADAERRDAILGTTFLVGSAGTLIAGTRIVEELQDVQTLLFGTAVAVVPEDFAELVTVCVLVVALHVWWARGFIAIAIDPDDAQVRGLPVRLLEFVLLATVAITISVATRVLGALPAFAFSVLPAVAALRLARNTQVALILSAVFGSAIGAIGYYVAFAADLPVGASQAMVGVVWVVVAATCRAIWSRFVAR